MLKEMAIDDNVVEVLRTRLLSHSGHVSRMDCNTHVSYCMIMFMVFVQEAGLRSDG